MSTADAPRRWSLLWLVEQPMRWRWRSEIVCRRPSPRNYCRLAKESAKAMLVHAGYAGKLKFMREALYKYNDIPNAIN